MPQPKSMLEATAEANNLAAVSSAKALYVRNMEEICGGDSPYLNSETLQREHENCFNAAVQLFKKTRKMGGTEFSIAYLQKLEEDITEQFTYFARANDNKNLFKSMRTPAVLITLMIMDYILQEIFQFVGLDSVAGIFTSIFFIATIALVTWCYVRYSGNGREAGQLVDTAANWTWDNFLSQFMLPATQAGLQLATNVSIPDRVPGLMSYFQATATKKRN